MNLQLRNQPGRIRRSITGRVEVPSRGYVTRNPRTHYPYSNDANFQPTESSQIHGGARGRIEQIRNSF